MPRSKGGSSGSSKAVTYEAYDASHAPVAAAGTTPEPVAEVAEPKKKKSAGDFVNWLVRKAR